MRSAVVTGAHGTLGGELVELLTAAGHEVVAVSRSGRAPGRGEARVVAADLGSDASVDVIKAALDGREVAVAIHAVGLPGSPGVLDTAPGLLGDAVNIKAGGFLRLVAGVRDSLAPDARLIAVGGHLGAEPTEHAPLAGVANAALANLVRQLAHPVARLGATVHLVAPGPFDSPRVDALLERTAAATGRSLADVRADALAEYPGGRMPTAREVAEVVVSLTSPASRALHGSTIFADGGIKHSIF